MLIYDLIHTEDIKAQHTARKLEDSSNNREPDRQQELLEKLAAQLDEVVRLEDDWLLPLVIADPRTSGVAQETRRRREEARVHLEQMAMLAAEPPRFGTQARILTELLRELGTYRASELFPRAREVISDGHARDLALLAQGKEPPPVGVVSL